MPSKGARALDFAESILGSRISGLCCGTLRLNLCHFGFRVALFLFLLQQGGISLGTLHGLFRLL